MIYIPSEDDFSILNEIGRWKVIPQKDLYGEMMRKVQYSPFCRKIKRLEKHGLLKSFRGGRGRKFLTLTDSGGKLSHFGNIYCENENELGHDLLCSVILKKLLNYKNFDSGEVYHGDGDLIPDGFIHARKNDEPYTLALEIELHQKSAPRVKSKFKKYACSQMFTHVLYVMPKESIFHSYRKILLEMNREVQQTVVLLFNKDLTIETFNFLDSLCFLKGEEQSFEEIFE